MVVEALFWVFLCFKFVCWLVVLVFYDLSTLRSFRARSVNQPIHTVPGQALVHIISPVTEDSVSSYYLFKLFVFVFQVTTV